MFEKSAMLYLYVETPLHAGSGSSLGIVDLPIQRERTTGYPIVQASGLKGCLREAAGTDAQKIKVVFGPETSGSDEHAGAVSVGDARILLFPVRSLMGVFAWVTSKDVLARFKRDAQMAGVTVSWTETGPTTDDTALVASNTLVSNNRVVLEEFAFTEQQDNAALAIANWLACNALPNGDEYKYWKDALPQRLVILPENAFRDFTQFSTEVISRIRLKDDTKTVAPGALWSEEHLPSDTLLYAALFASKPRVKDADLPDDWKQASDKVGEVIKFVKDCVDGKRLQLGGDSTVGRGFVKVRMEVKNDETISPANP
jgi:CRISPR-associated protein Cmr4